MNAATSNAIEKEKERILCLFAGNLNARCRASVKVARRIIINAPYMFQGRLWDIKSKNLGAGVYELSLKEFE